MARDNEYLKIQNMYNIAVAKAQDLKETLEVREKQWEKQEEDFSVTEKLMRQLCEDILAKDPKEMVLGADYSWSSIPVNELINKSRNVFRQYITKQKDFMKRIMDLSEERRLEIESLNEQITVMRSNPNTMGTLSQEELKAQIEKEKKEKEAVEKLPQNMKKAAEEGDIKVSYEADDEIDDFEDIVMQDMADKGEQVKITPKSIPVTENRKRMERKKERKEQAVIAHTIDLKKYEEKMNEVSWLVMEAVGEGKSRYTEIESYVMEKDTGLSKNKARIAVGILENMGVLNKETVSTPFKGTLYVYQMTDVGSRIYKDKYGKLPGPSELDIVTAEHDNPTHGYGILFLAEMLRDSGDYETVSDRNRKDPISVGNNISYIPDIICTDKGGAKMYIEYELGNHTQTNFTAKCNKMCKVTSVLNFVGPNRKTVDKLMSEVESWINSRGDGKSIRHVTVRITSATQMKDMDLSKNQSWKVVYRPGKSKEPYINF